MVEIKNGGNCFVMSDQSDTSLIADLHGQKLVFSKCSQARVWQEPPRCRR